MRSSDPLLDKGAPRSDGPVRQPPPAPPRVPLALESYVLHSPVVRAVAKALLPLLPLLPIWDLCTDLVTVQHVHSLAYAQWPLVLLAVLLLGWRFAVLFVGLARAGPEDVAAARLHSIAGAALLFIPFTLPWVLPKPRYQPGADGLGDETDPSGSDGELEAIYEEAAQEHLLPVRSTTAISPVKPTAPLPLLPPAVPPSL